MTSASLALAWHQGIAPAFETPAAQAALGRLLKAPQVQRIADWIEAHRPPPPTAPVSPKVCKDPAMNKTPVRVDTRRYAKCIDASKRIRWDIDRDVIRGRDFDLGDRFLPNGLSKVDEIGGLSRSEQRLLSQIQGRTYANLFAVVVRFIGAKVLQLTRAYWFADQTALEALVRFSDEELKHQQLFRRIETMLDAAMPPGYRCTVDGDALAKGVLAKSNWAVLALTCHIELFTQAHYRQSIDGDDGVSELFKEDIFLFHWKEESQHAILDELEWQQEDARLTPAQRDAAVADLIALVLAFDAVLQQQAAADTAYFGEHCGRTLAANEAQEVEAGVLAAYRWQYLISGFQEPRFSRLLSGFLDAEQLGRLYAALAPVMA